MRKSFVALALLVGAAAMLTTPAVVQAQGFGRSVAPRGKTAESSVDRLTSAARLRTSADSDTFFLGHSSVTPFTNPFHIGAGSYRPGVGGNYDNMWDFDNYDGGTIDSLQGWVPFHMPYLWGTGVAQPDNERPWFALDQGNRMNAAPIQGRTAGIISAWHADDGDYTASGVGGSWDPLGGSTMSAWCGLRAGNDNTVVDDTTYGGTGNAINGEVLYGNTWWWDIGNGTYKNFPGYANQWDQILYRDVRVASGASLTVRFLYETEMSEDLDPGDSWSAGWFDKDPLAVVDGNFISITATGNTAPIDSFMVYVGVPTDPTAWQSSDVMIDPAPIPDLQRRWFSEVIAIDKPYKEILSTFGKDSVYRDSPFEATLAADGILKDMLDAQDAGGNGVIRIAFRCKTNNFRSDETDSPTPMSGSTHKGAVRIDNVEISGLAVSDFEDLGDINNKIEAANVAGIPNVGEGYALDAWHATGRPMNLIPHTHPLDRTDISNVPGEENWYEDLAFYDLCGAWNSPDRICNINKVVLALTDHANGEASSGLPGTAFAEVNVGAISPAICLITPETGPNDWGLDRAHVENGKNWSMRFDIYTGFLGGDYDGYAGCYFTSMSYPTQQENGADVWGDVSWNGWTGFSRRGCAIYNFDITSSVWTSNESGLPDSIKLVLWRLSMDYYVGGGLSMLGCDMDNITMVFPGGAGAAVNDAISLNTWSTYSDAFPVNSVEVPGEATFDTCAANIKTAQNRAYRAGTRVREVIPEDSMIVVGVNPTGAPARMDCVFRIYPGPGNYHIIGDKGSGLRTWPTDTANIAVASDGSFWGQYMATSVGGNPTSPYGKGNHASGWDPNTWNSVRLDTAEINIFPAQGYANNIPGIANDFWSSTYHEDDPNFTTLGISKNRCFPVVITGAPVINSSNITCGIITPYPPVWVNTDAGYNGTPTTIEYTKIFPNRLLTPGSQVQYFFRMSHIGSEETYAAIAPDTNAIFPQGTDSDGTRWKHFGILPDRWKSYGTGLGAACMLVLDYADRRGQERVWVGIADSIGATSSGKYGAGNGWHASGAYVGATYGTHDYNSETDCGTNPNIAVWDHRGQPGSTWDMYNVNGIEDNTFTAMGIGGRLAPLPTGLQVGMGTTAPPTVEMLRYYSLLFIMTGDLPATLGRFVNHGSPDIGMVGTQFLADMGTESDPKTRGVWIMGEKYVEGITLTYPYIDQMAFLSDRMGVSLRAGGGSYAVLAGTNDNCPDLIPGTFVSRTGSIYGVRSSCVIENDVLVPNTATRGAQVGSLYEPLGPAPPYVASVYTPHDAVIHPGVSLMDGFNIQRVLSRGGGNTVGRLEYFMDVMVKAFSSVCTFTAAPTVEVLNPDAGVANIDFLGNVVNNPLSVGVAKVSFSLARAIWWTSGSMTSVAVW